MRQKRAKAYRKLMSLYCLSFGFRQPYQALGVSSILLASIILTRRLLAVDSEMCKDAVSHKVDLVKQLTAVLQGSVKPMITQCCIHELYLQGKSNQSAVDLAKSFERRKCNHKEAIPGDECLTSVIGENNKHRYVLVTQSQSLRSNMRNIPAVPIVHINRSVMILEPPSDATIRAKNATEQKSLKPSASELAHIASTSKAEEGPPKKRKGPKGPNPLSMKKKKKETPSSLSKPRESVDTKQVTQNVGEKRKRSDDGVSNAHAHQEGMSTATGGHKRKRRRKTNAASAPSDASVEG
ncbi:Fcf1-domain-containing protein [Irpex rosettiformis]|uniref:Fcf1-domain-containing protein n=1 Tax=Irpex rosettiformis TaxID=378272 RepID=A0ACB8ULW7_9APHY|nr:Fcf1-domain-containing protein [Irpex rosettiformis]